MTKDLKDLEINEMAEDELREELASVGLEITGGIDELRERLKLYYETPPQ